MIVNPSINISIGDYGEKYLTSFHDYFNEHEQRFTEFASFYNIYYRENKLSIVSDGNNISDSIIELSTPVNARSDIRNQLSEQKDTFLKFINASYNQTVNLFNQRAGIEDFSINFNIINFNIIISGFEEYNGLLLEALVNNIKKLSDDNLIADVSIKAFVVLFTDNEWLSRDEQINTCQLFEEIKIIREKASEVFSNIVFIDEKNTGTVFLGIDEKSIGFVLNEFITYLMTNPGKMIGGLMNPEYVSLGLGTLNFDYSYFKTFFRHKIISRLMLNERFRNPPNDINSINKISETIKPFVSQDEQAEEVFSRINMKISEVEGKNYSLLEYKFILASLLGRYDDLPGSGSLLNIEKIALSDLFFSYLNELYSYLDNDSYVNILDHKILKDEIIDLENEFKQLNNKNKNGIYDIRINKIKEEIAAKSELAEKQSKIINQTLSHFRNPDYQEEIANEIIPEFDKKIQVLSLELREIQNEQISFIRRIVNFISGKPGKKDRIEEYQNKIRHLEDRKQKINSLYASIITKTKPLSDFVKELDKKYSILSDSLKEIRRIGQEFKKNFNETDLIKCIFVRNVIDEGMLDQYFINNQADLLNSLEGLSGEISILYDEPNPLSEFSTLIYSKIDNAIKSIIDFNILNYLNGKYDNMQLFNTVDFQEVIKDLLKISLPFINVTNAHDNNHSHVMRLHNSSNDEQVDQLNNNLLQCFPAAIPQEINTLNNHKFSIVKVDLIKEFAHIAKYKLYKC